MPKRPVNQIDPYGTLVGPAVGAIFGGVTGFFGNLGYQAVLIANGSQVGFNGSALIGSTIGGAVGGAVIGSLIDPVALTVGAIAFTAVAATTTGVVAGLGEVLLDTVTGGPHSMVPPSTPPPPRPNVPRVGQAPPGGPSTSFTYDRTSGQFFIDGMQVNTSVPDGNVYSGPPPDSTGTGGWNAFGGGGYVSASSPAEGGAGGGSLGIKTEYPEGQEAE